MWRRTCAPTTRRPTALRRCQRRPEAAAAARGGGPSRPLRQPLPRAPRPRRRQCRPAPRHHRRQAAALQPKPARAAAAPPPRKRGRAQRLRRALRARQAAQPCPSHQPAVAAPGRTQAPWRPQPGRKRNKQRVARRGHLEAWVQRGVTAQSRRACGTMPATRSPTCAFRQRGRCGEAPRSPNNAVTLTYAAPGGTPA